MGNLLMEFIHPQYVLCFTAGNYPRPCGMMPAGRYPRPSGTCDKNLNAVTVAGRSRLVGPDIMYHGPSVTGTVPVSRPRQLSCG